MLKKVLECILWQNYKKPQGKSEYFLTIMHWILVLILLGLLIGLLWVLDFNVIIKFLIALYMIPNILCLGAGRMFALEKGLGPIYALIGKLGVLLPSFI